MSLTGTNPVAFEVSPRGPTDFAAFYHDHYARLVTALRSAGADAARSEDIAQEAFARTFRYWSRVRDGSNPAGYAYRTAFRLLYRRGRPPTSRLDDVEPVVPGHEEASAARMTVEAALSAMPPRRRACTALCLYLGLPVNEAAEILGIAPGTVRKQLELARQALRIALR